MTYQNLLLQLRDRIASSYAFTAEASLAFRFLTEHLLSLQRDDGIPAETRSIFIGRTTPTDPNAAYQYKDSAANVLERSERSGPNMQAVTGAALVSLFSTWELHFRPELVKLAGAEVASPIFGDIRHLRNGLAHDGMLRKQLSVIDGFEVSHPIKFEDGSYYKICSAAIGGLNEISSRYFGAEGTLSLDTKMTGWRGRPFDSVPSETVS